MADNPFGRAIPAPCGLLTVQVNTAEPSIDAVQVDLVYATFKDLSPCFCDRYVTQSLLRCVRYLSEGMPSLGQIGHYLIKRCVPHEDLLLHIPDRDEEPWPRERTLITKDVERLALCTRQAVIGRRKLFQMT